MLMGGSHLSVAARRSVGGAGREAERDFSVTVNRRLRQFVIALLFLSFLPFFPFNFFNYLKFILSLRDVGFKETPTRVCGFV